MINVIKISMLILLFVVNISCKKKSKCFHSTGKYTTETRILSFFDKVKINSLFDVYWHNDSSYKVKIEGGDKLIPFVETRVSNKYLIITNENRCNWLRKYERIKVHIYSPSLSDFIIVGSGNYYLIDTLVSDSFKIENWSDISKVYANVKCRWFAYTQHAGTGDTYIGGSSTISYLWISGMGYLHAKNLVSIYNYITNKSTGNCYVYAKKEAGAYIYKSGNIYLYGNPDTVFKKIYGIGKLYLIN